MSLMILITLLLVGGLAAWQAERISPTLPRHISLAIAGLALLYLASIVSDIGLDQLSVQTRPGDPQSWLIHWRVDWIPRFGIGLELAMDGLSLLLVGLTLLLGLIAVSASWSEIDFKPGLFQANILWTLAGVCGVFLALDLFLFFLFWEVMLIPMYLLIAVWGHEILHIHPGIRATDAAVNCDPGLPGLGDKRPVELQLFRLAGSRD